MTDRSLAEVEAAAERVQADPQTAAAQAAEVLARPGLGVEARTVAAWVQGLATREFGDLEGSSRDGRPAGGAGPGHRTGTTESLGQQAEHPALRHAFAPREPAGSWTSVSNHTEPHSRLGIMDEDVPDDDVLDPPPAGGERRWLDIQAGHGTFVAGLVARLAPDARVEVEAVINSWGLGDHATVARGLRQARHRLVEQGTPVAVVTMSLTGYTEDDRPHPFLQAEMRELVRAHRLRDLPLPVFVAAAGNGSSSRPAWPATRSAPETPGTRC